MSPRTSLASSCFFWTRTSRWAIIPPFGRVVSVRVEPFCRLWAMWPKPIEIRDTDPSSRVQSNGLGDWTPSRPNPQLMQQRLITDLWKRARNPKSPGPFRHFEPRKSHSRSCLVNVAGMAAPRRSGRGMLHCDGLGLALARWGWICSCSLCSVGWSSVATASVQLGRSQATSLEQAVTHKSCPGSALTQHLKGVNCKRSHMP